MYEDANCAFLTEHEDTLQFYIAQNEHAASSKPAEKPIERELYDYVAEKQSHDVALMVLSGKIFSHIGLFQKIKGGNFCMVFILYAYVNLIS
jgi:hypothetical protein